MRIILSKIACRCYKTTAARYWRITATISRYRKNSSKQSRTNSLLPLSPCMTYRKRRKRSMLVTIMRNFKAKVLNEIENIDDKKGNVSQVRRQTVEGNQPPSFDLCIPIFKGQPKQKFTVEIDINPDTLQATLVSPDAQDLIVETRDKLIDDVLLRIEQTAPDIPIIEI